MPPTPQVQQQPSQAPVQGPQPLADSPLSALLQRLRGLSFADGMSSLSPGAQQGPAAQGVGAGDKAVDDKPVDPQTKLSRELWAAYPAGVPIAIYDPGEPEIASQAKAWAKSQGAIGSKGKGLGAGQLGVGLAIPATQGLGAIMAEVGPSLQALSEKGRPARRPAGSGPAQVGTLGIFSHGTAGWLGMSSNTSKDDVSKGGIGKLIAGISGWLSGGVNVILYACSAARGTDEKESWVDGTTKGGGATSLGGAIRDALVDAGKDDATVTGHTTVGHVTRNFALREFKAADGKGAAGLSFLEEHAWDWQTLTPPEVFAEIEALGYAVPDPKHDKVRNTILSKTKSAIYKVYAGVMQSEKLDGQDLAAIAPVKPEAVGKLVRDKWLAAFDGGIKTELAKGAVKAHNLAKL